MDEKIKNMENLINVLYRRELDEQPTFSEEMQQHIQEELSRQKKQDIPEPVNRAKIDLLTYK